MEGREVHQGPLGWRCVEENEEKERMRHCAEGKGMV